MSAAFVSLSEFSVDGRALELPPLSPDCQPSSRALARWRVRAEIECETALAWYDEALLTGVDPAEAARQALDRSIDWVRRSLMIFATDSGETVVRGALREEHILTWRVRTLETIQAATVHPGAVDDHLHAFVELAHRAASAGYASLLCGWDPGPPRLAML